MKIKSITIKSEEESFKDGSIYLNGKSHSPTYLIKYEETTMTGLKASDILQVSDKQHIIFVMVDEFLKSLAKETENHFKINSDK